MDFDLWAQLLFFASPAKRPSRFCVPRRRRRPAARLLAVEVLEDRQLLSAGLVGVGRVLGDGNQGPLRPDQLSANGEADNSESEVYRPDSADPMPDAAVQLKKLGDPVAGVLDRSLAGQESQARSDAVFTTKNPQEPDEYPLPPLVGPRLQGDIEARPAAVALLLPLEGSPQAMAPTLLTFSGGENRAAAAITPAEFALPSTGGQTPFSLAPPSSSATARGASQTPVSGVARLGEWLPRSGPGVFDTARDVDTSLDPFETKLRLSQVQNTAGGRQAPDSPLTDAVSGNPVCCQPFSDDGPQPSVWVAAAEIRVPAPAEQPQERVASGKDQLATLAGSVRTAGQRSANRTGRQTLRQPVIILLLASAAGLARRSRHAVARTTRALCRRLFCYFFPVRILLKGNGLERRWL